MAADAKDSHELLWDSREDIQYAINQDLLDLLQPDTVEKMRDVFDAAHRFWATTDASPLTGLSADQCEAWDGLCAAFARPRGRASSW